MALVPYLTKDDMNESNRPFADELERPHTRPPWLRMLGAHYQPFLDATDAMYPKFMEEGEIARATKELIFVACADVRGCAWCRGSHSRYLVQEIGLTREQVKRAREGGDETGISDLQKLLVAFGRKVAKNPRDIGEADIAELRAAGLSDSQIVEIIAVCSFSAFTNTFTDTLKMADDLEMMGLEEEWF